MANSGSVGVQGKRLARTVSCKIHVDDNTWDGKCDIVGSVRLASVALRVEGGPENWAHMDTKQCRQLIKYLQRALIEAEKRQAACRKENTDG